jgi:MYXO-CTERM domain-containing protein
MACAAALGVADQDDATIKSVLLPGLTWTRPEGPDDGKGMYAAHLLALVAWDRRGWAAHGADTGAISFYGGLAIGGDGDGGGSRPSGGSAKSCNCNLGGRGHGSGLALLAVVGLGLLLRTREWPRRHS